MATEDRGRRRTSIHWGTLTPENLETGQQWGLRDAVMEVFRGEPQHNFWTRAPINPGTTYGLVVSEADGDTTRTTTPTPDVPPATRVSGEIKLPCLSDFFEANTFDVRVRDVKKLAALRVRYFQTFQESVNYTFDRYDETTKNGDRYKVTVNSLKDLRVTNRRVGRSCIADSARVLTAAGGRIGPLGLATVMRPSRRVCVRIPFPTCRADTACFQACTPTRPK